MKNRRRQLHGAYILVVMAMLYIIWEGNRAVTAFSESTPVKRSRCIIIDPGHGGVDGGATSCTGRLESGLNLEIALRLKDLMQLLGYETKMTRTTDTSIHTKGETVAQQKVSDLQERVSICNTTENALLLSIHQNNFQDSRYSGAQVFYAPTQDSDLLAKKLQDSFRQTLNPGSQRQAKPADKVYLMSHIRCTGVLIECGFLSNPQEEAKLRDREYQQKICAVIAATVSKFLDG